MSLPDHLRDHHPLPRTHNALYDAYQAAFFSAVKDGTYEPFTWPYHSLGSIVLIAYLLLPPTNSKLIRYAFYPVYGFFAYWCIRAVFETKSASMAGTYGMGLVNTWGVLWVAARCIFTDFRTARRIEQRAAMTREEQNGTESSTTAMIQKTDSVRARGSKAIDTSDSQSMIEYYWQTLPERFTERSDFITDLLFSMRGPGWAHQARSIPGPPKRIVDQLHPAPRSTKPVVRDYKDKESLIRTNVVRFLLFSVYLDIIKTFMTHDEYFLGFVNPTPPAPRFFPTIIRESKVLTRCYRLTLAMLGTRIALGMIFSLSPIFFAGILGPRFMGLRAEPWYYSDFGGDWRYLLSNGIAGWWGAWWHQIFRLGFEAPSRWLCEKAGWSPRSLQGKMIGIFVAFGCSGVLHALASVAMLPETKPWSGSFRFFLLQALGTIVEDGARQVFRKAGVTQKLPKLAKQTVVIIWLLLWAYYTGPLIVDDFSRSGVWLFEPVPFSILAMLEFREKNDHWWRWRARNVYWHTGNRWWKSGIAM